MADLEAAVAWAEAIARDDSHGYSQGGREGQDFDCSSLVCRSLRAAGFGAPSPSFSTRTMGDWLGRNGWVWHKGTSGVRRGDILWKTGHTGWATNGYRAVEARIDERGRVTGGRPGDQTGSEIGFFNVSSMAWQGYWRYEGSAAGSAPGYSAGRYRVKSGPLNVRSGPGLSYGVTGTLPAGYVLNSIAAFTSADGHVWGRYTTYSGRYRYVAMEYMERV